MNSVSPLSTAYGSTGSSGSDTRIEIDSGECPGGLEHREAHLAELHRVAVRHRRERILGPGPRAEMDRGALALAKLEVAGNEVGVEMRQEHVTDPAAEPAGVVEVLLDVALWVDHGRGSTRLVGD